MGQTARQTKDFFEFTAIPVDRIDKEAGVIRRIALLGSASVNRRVYQPNVLKDFYEHVKAHGLKAYEGHTTPTETRERRGDRHTGPLIGKFTNPTLDMQESKVYADLHLLKHTKDRIMDMAESMGDMIGFSPHVNAAYTIRNGVEVVDELINACTGDLVSYPATNKGMFESIENDPTEGGEDNMFEWSKVTIADLKENAPALLEQLVADARSKDQSAVQVKQLTESNEAQAKKIKDFEEAETKRTEEKAVAEMIESSKVLKKTLPAGSEGRARVVRVLSSMQESDRTGYLKDLEEVARGQKTHSVTNTPASKTMSESAEDEDEEGEEGEEDGKVTSKNVKRGRKMILEAAGRLGGYDLDVDDEDEELDEEDE